MTGFGCGGATPDCDTLTGSLTRCPAPPSLLASAGRKAETPANNSAAQWQSAVQSATDPSYSGCYAQSVGDQLLKSKSWTGSGLTIERCAAHCSDYDFFAVESATR